MLFYHPEKYRINGDVEDIDTIIIADKAEFITSFCEGYYEETSKCRIKW